MSNQAQDRFQNISNNYGKLFTEVFAVQGLDYTEFERSVFDNVKKLKPNFRDVPILDIGVGDGKTSEMFLEAGCKKIVGIDLNQHMLNVAKEKFGNSVKLFLMNATNMSFTKGEFPIIITGAAIHNIPKKERIKFWNELLRLNPDIFVSAEKIADPDPKKHKAYFDNEINAIKKVYGEIHNLPDVEEEWLAHYEYDEKERLELNEINENLGEKYDIKIALEMGMCKTIVAVRKQLA